MREVEQIMIAILSNEEYIMRNDLIQVYIIIERILIHLSFLFAGPPKINTAPKYDLDNGKLTIQLFSLDKETK